MRFQPKPMLRVAKANTPNSELGSGTETCPRAELGAGTEAGTIALAGANPNVLALHGHCSQKQVLVGFDR